MILRIITKNVNPLSEVFKAKAREKKYFFISDKSGKINRKVKKYKIYRKKRLLRFNYQRFTIDPYLMLITDVLIKELDKNRDISFNYKNFIEVDGQKFPSDLRFVASDLTNTLSCHIHFSKILVDTDFKLLFRISSRYKSTNPGN